MFLRVSWPIEEVASGVEVRLESKTHIIGTVVDGIRVRRSQQKRTRLLTMIGFIKKQRSWSMQRVRMVLLCSTEVQSGGIGTSPESARKEW